MASYLTETGLNTLVAKIKGLFASHTTNTSNPHEVTKTQLGLGSVENKSSETIRNEITSENIISALGYTPSSEKDNSDTKNTTGATDTANKIYLVGALTQEENPVTYSHDTVYVGADGCLYSNGAKVSDVNHTHSYAGSSSNGGAATSANKLNTNAGSATQPVYFKDGIPVATTYTLGKSVPSDAVFTDTTYSNFVKSGSGAKAGLVPAPSTTAGTTKYLREDGTWVVPTDTKYTHPTYTARTGVPTANQTPAFGGTFNVSQPVSDATGHITAVNSRTITIPNATATSSANGLMSSTDKAKLDAITASADAVSVTQKLTSGTEIGTVTVNGTGTKLYAPTNTDTHYTSKNVVGSSTATSNTTSALTNGNVYLNSVENSAVTSSHKISGSGATTVTTDTSGNILISSTDNNTKNTAGSTNSSSKLFLIGATSQAANPQTYSHDTAYVGTDGCLYSNSSKVIAQTDCVGLTETETDALM